MMRCKECGESLNKSLINNGRKYCSRKCRKEAMQRNNAEYNKRSKNRCPAFGVPFDSSGNSV